MGITDPRYQTHVKPESIWYYCFLNDGDVYYAKELNITGSNSFTEGTLDPVTFYSPGVKLFAVMEENRDQSATGNLVVTVYGWEQDGSTACSGTFTFRPYAPRDEAVECVSNCTSGLFMGISSVAITGGTPGEKVKIFFLPAASDFNRLGFDPMVALDPGPEFFNVPRNWDPKDHQKRQRSVNDITISDKYQHESGSVNIMTLKGYSVLLLEQQTDNDSSYVKQLRIVTRCGIENTPVGVPAEDGTDPLAVEVTGNYTRKATVLATSDSSSAAYIT